MDSFSQFPVAELSGLGAQLHRIRAVLDAPVPHSVPGAGCDGQDELDRAMAAFRSRWSVHVSTLIDNIGQWGYASSAIAAKADAVDGQGAALFQRIST